MPDDNEAKDGPQVCRTAHKTFRLWTLGQAQTIAKAEREKCYQLQRALDKVVAAQRKASSKQLKRQLRKKSKSDSGQKARNLAQPHTSSIRQKLGNPNPTKLRNGTPTIQHFLIRQQELIARLKITAKEQLAMAPHDNSRQTHTFDKQQTTAAKLWTQTTKAHTKMPQLQRGTSQSAKQLRSQCRTTTSR